jgi:hypothetical protein
MAQSVGNAKNILVGASPLFLSNIDINDADYSANAEPGVKFPASASGSAIRVPAFVTGQSYTTTLNAIDQTAGDFGYRNVGFTNNGLQITYNPTYDSVTVDQLLDTAKLFKSAMEVMIASEMSEGTLENIVAVFGQSASSIDSNDLTGTAKVDTLNLEAGSLGAAPTERQLIAVGLAPTASSTASERIYYARRVLSVQQSQFSLARTTPTTFPVTFRLLPDANYSGSEYGKIIDRVLVA